MVRKKATGKKASSKSKAKPKAKKEKKKSRNEQIRDLQQAAGKRSVKISIACDHSVQADALIIAVENALIMNAPRKNCYSVKVTK